jgi:hydroxymethylbilane synthase
MKPIRIGTRKSKLALWQAQHVRALIVARVPGQAVELVEFTTQGDRVLDKPLPEIGGKGVFTQELESALRSGEIDMAVHSLKDLPTDMPADFVIGATPQRASPFDALVTRDRCRLLDLKHGALVGTSSYRRAAQLLAQRPDLVVKPIRGNVESRVRKVHDGEFDAAILAVAGLQRLDMAEVIDEIFMPAIMLPAPGQGAIGVQTSAGHLQEILQAIDHFETRIAVTAERAFLNQLDAGCSLPVAAYAWIEGDRLLMRGRVSDMTGGVSINVAGDASLEESEALGRGLAQSALNDGADILLTALRQELNQ